MRSRLPKVLHPVCGRPLLHHVIEAARRAAAKRIICVLGAEADRVQESLSDMPVEIAIQEERLGTGHAVLQTRDLLKDHQGAVAILNGALPLLTAASIERLVTSLETEKSDLSILTAEHPESSDFGRLVRDGNGRIQRIVEYHDATPEQRQIREVNVGAYALDAGLLFRTLDQVGNDNPKGEYYLTNIVQLILADGGSVSAAAVDEKGESEGVNSRADLARAEMALQRRIAEYWMLQGVTIENPAATYIGADVTIGNDSVLGAGVNLRGKTRVGSGCRIDAGSFIEDSTIGDNAWIKPGCVIEESHFGADCVTGPNAHFRPNSVLSDGCRVGNFVEVKNSSLGAGTKADHLSYIGDADIGSGVTFACGAITVNYDGRQKQRTTIGDGAFIGCNANLIAPVVIESQGYVAAGSTITDGVPPRALAVARQRQRNIEGWWDKHFGDDSDD